jgi:hypothetical protein
MVFPIILKGDVRVQEGFAQIPKSSSHSSPPFIKSFAGLIQ